MKRKFVKIIVFVILISVILTVLLFLFSGIPTSCPDALKIDYIKSITSLANGNSWTEGLTWKDVNLAKDGTVLDLGSCHRGSTNGENLNTGYCNYGRYFIKAPVDAQGNIGKNSVYNFGLKFNLSSETKENNVYSYKIISMSCTKLN